MHFVKDKILEYTGFHTTPEPALLAELRRETWQKVLMPKMLSGHRQGRLLAFLSKLLRPRNILEIGTYTGYATLCLAEGLASGGKIYTIDNNEELIPIQEKYFQRSGYDAQILRYRKNAMEVLQTLTVTFDLVFLDADKHNYPLYYPLIKKRMRPGGLIIADNVLWSGKVLDPDQKDKDTEGIRTFNEMVRTDLSVEKIMLPFRDGLFLIKITE